MNEAQSLTVEIDVVRVCAQAGRGASSYYSTPLSRTPIWSSLKMFVPRAVRLKGVKETQRPKLPKSQAKPPPSKDETNSKDALVEAMGETSMNSPAPQQDTTRGPRFTSKPVTPDYIAQLAAGIELIFTDYAHQEEERSKWLKDHYRVVDGEENCKPSTERRLHSY